MTITLDAATEERLNSEMQKSGYTSAADFIQLALDRVQEDAEDVESWKQYFAETIERRSTNVDAGNFYTAEEAKAKLAEMRGARTR